MSEAATVEEIGRIQEQHAGSEQYWVTLKRVGDTSDADDDEDDGM